MIGYDACEKAVAERLTYHLGLSDPDLCQCGNLDKLFARMQATSSNLGVLLEYESGEKLRNRPFDGNAWMWVTTGVLMIRFQGDSDKIEQDARHMIDRVLSAFDGHKTLAQQVAKAEIGSIGRPEVAKVNDIPFYLVGFTVELTERI